MDHEALARHARARSGVNMVVYLIIRALFQPFFHIYFRMARIGREHVPRSGPVIIAANHRSFLDPFVIGTMARRPMYYVAKQELFRKRWMAWILSALGAFPVKRGMGDEDSVDTAKAILARGDIVLMFPEGTRTRPGALGKPKRGVGRLALETGAPVVPVAIIGTEAVRHGWRIRRARSGCAPAARSTSRSVDHPSPQLAGAVTDRIWPCVMLQWEWLGGLAPIRRAAIVGAGSWGTSLAITLARAGLEVDLGCRTEDQAEAIRSARRNDRYLPGVELSEQIRPLRAAELELGDHDLILLAVPARALPNVMAAHGERIPRRAGVLVLSKGLVPPLGTLPSAFASERCGARAVAALGGPAHAAEVLENGASVVIATHEEGFARQLADVLRSVGIDVSRTADVTGVELAGCAKNAAALAAAAAAAGRSECRRGRSRQGVRRGRRAGANPGRAPGDVRGTGRSRRPGGDRRRRRLSQPARGGAARSGRPRDRDRAGARPHRRGGRLGPAAGDRGAGRSGRGAGARQPRRARRGPDRSGALDRDRHGSRLAAAKECCPRRLSAATLRCVADPLPKNKVELDARFSDLYRAHLRDVYSYSYYRVGNHHDAEDLTEQTFLQAYRHFERALRESNGRPLRPWLIRIAHNLAANFYRDRSRRPESAIEDAGMVSAPHTTESLVEGREELSAILEGVQKLPDDRREALIMRFALGMDNREIARALGRSDGATKVLLHRAIKQLEEIVSEAPRPEARRSSRTVSASAPDFESLLRQALHPVEPPTDLRERLEATLVSLTEAAQEELDAWELSSMRDPRNWVRPAAAAAVGVSAGRHWSCSESAPVTARASSSRATRSSSRRGRCATSPSRRGGSARSASRPPSARAGPLLASTRNGSLLPAPLARDRRVVLVVRAADLPRLHDSDFGRDALPGVLPRPDQGQDRADAHQARRSSRRR